MNDITKDIVIIGGGGFALEVYSYIIDENKFNIKGYINEKKDCELIESNNKLRYLGNIEDYNSKANDRALICIGNPVIRRKIFSICNKKSLNLCSYFHPTSYISSSASIGKGVIVAPHCIISSNAVIESNVFLNVYCGVGHGAKIGPNTIMSPYSVINGDCVLGEAVFLGSRVTLNPKIKVDSFSSIDTGCVLRGDVSKFSLVSQRVEQMTHENRILKDQILSETL